MIRRRVGRDAGGMVVDVVVVCVGLVVLRLWVVDVNVRGDTEVVICCAAVMLVILW